MASEESRLKTEEVENLQSELKSLIARREDVVEQLSKGREAGNMRESVDSDDAIEELLIVDSRIREIKNSLPNDAEENDTETELRNELRKIEILLPFQSKKLSSTPEYIEVSVKKRRKNKDYTQLRNIINNYEVRSNHILSRLQHIITPTEEMALRQELEDLQIRRKPALAQKLKAARAQGDLKENADYHDAKEQLGIIEGRVQEIENKLQLAIIKDDAGPSDEVRIGSTVVIQEEGYEDKEKYRIVGSAEANPREDKISYESPIGSALLGKKRDSTIKVQTPDGMTTFKILEIR